MEHGSPFWVLKVLCFRGIRLEGYPRNRRFLPNSRASTDQAPGPSMASAAAIVANRICAHTSPCLENADHNATTENTLPAIGVHNPTQSNNPAMPSIRIRATLRSEASPPPTKWNAATVVMSRRHRRPAPGQPRAKLEYSRCKLGSQCQRNQVRGVFDSPIKVLDVHSFE